jgi:hypothetical protein
MLTPEERLERWSRGYIDGYRELRSAIPEVPSLPSLPADAGDPFVYYYNEGRKQGRDKAIRDGGVLGKP